MRDADQINGALGEISLQVLPEGLALRYVAVDDIREQDLNAQSMTKAMFDQLVSNIGEAGVLESIPLCATVAGEGDQIWMVSGHHRLRAARAAGQTHMLILIYEALTWDRVRSKQLAHNSIAGTSDPELIKRIWEQIDDVKARFESFIDPRMFDNIPPAVSFKPVDVNMQNFAKTVVIAFLPVQHSDFEAAVEACLPKGDVDKVYLAHQEHYEAWMEALRKVREDLDIVAIPTALAAMARLAVERLEEDGEP